jgi:hypothetical protein
LTTQKGGGVTSIEPYIRRRKRSACPHLQVDVCDDEARVVCVDCDAELDPWWVLRNMAHRHEVLTAHYESQRQEMAAQVDKHNAWIATANETIVAYNQQIQHLCDVKNRLSNEHIGGERLGTLARRRPRRRVPGCHRPYDTRPDCAAICGILKYGSGQDAARRS